MKKNGRFGKYGEAKKNERLKNVRRSTSKGGRETIKNDRHRKIAPGHPNTGRM